MAFLSVIATHSQPTPAAAGSTLLEAVKGFDEKLVRELIAKPEGKASLTEVDDLGNGPLHHIAKIGHYKYPPAGIPKLLIDSGIDVNAKNTYGATALDISLLSGWQKISMVLLDNGASKTVSSEVKARITCGDCKKVVRDYGL